jgi:hypothetical protein
MANLRVIQRSSLLAYEMNDNVHPSSGRNLDFQVAQDLVPKCTTRIYLIMYNDSRNKTEGIPTLSRPV